MGLPSVCLFSDFDAEAFGAAGTFHGMLTYLPGEAQIRLASWAGAEDMGSGIRRTTCACIAGGMAKLGLEAKISLIFSPTGYVIARETAKGRPYKQGKSQKIQDEGGYRKGYVKATEYAE